MNNDFRNDYSDYLMHYSVKGTKWNHHIYKKKEEQQSRQTGYQNARNAVQMVQNVSRDGLVNTVLQDAASRIPHFQPVGDPVNISSSKKNPKDKSTTNKRDMENWKREATSLLQQMSANSNQHQSNNPVLDLVQGKKRRKKQGR